MPTNDLSNIAQSLGNDLLTGLKTDLLSHVTDTVQLDLLTRATAKIGAAGIGLISPDPAMKAQATDDYNTALAVLLSLASAANEDAATARDAAMVKLGAFVNNFLTIALQSAIKAIPVFAVA